MDLKLLTYPRSFATSILGPLEVQQVLRELRQFARSYDDLDRLCASPRFERVVGIMLGGKGASVQWLCEESDALAFEAYGAHVSWLGYNCAVHWAAALLWTAHLCWCWSYSGIGVDSAIWGLTEYALHPSSDLGAVAVLGGMCEEIIQASPWEAIMPVLPLVATIALVLGRDTVYLEMLSKRAILEPEELSRLLLHWIDSEKQELLAPAHFALSLPEKSVSRWNNTYPRIPISAIKACLRSMLLHLFKYVGGRKRDRFECH